MVLRNPKVSAALLLLALLAPLARAQRPEATAGIYTCTDAGGRVITADRPIAACADREQRELGPSGTVRRRIEPTYTAHELAEREARARDAAQQAARLTEERRRNRALLMRYPSAASHDHERSEALAQIDAVIQAAKRRLAQLGDERKRIDEELEFYKKDVSKAPQAVRREVEDNNASAAVQNRFIDEQEDEKRRVNARFDDERARLKQLWKGG